LCETTSVTWRSLQPFLKRFSRKPIYVPILELYIELYTFLVRSYILSRVLPAGLARMEIVPFRTVRFETTPISVLDCNTSTQVASTGHLPPPFHTLAYNPYRLPEMDLAFRIEN
jgi:hypothetical protein